MEVSSPAPSGGGGGAKQRVTQWRCTVLICSKNWTICGERVSKAPTTTSTLVSCRNSTASAGDSAGNSVCISPSSFCNWASRSCLLATSNNAFISLYSLCHWKFNREDRSRTIETVCCRNGAAMVIHDATANRQPQASPLLFQRKERIEDGREVFGRNARPRIGDLDN